MARWTALLILLVLPYGASPLIAADDGLAEAEAAVAKAREQVETLKAELTGLYKELEHDLTLLRSERWDSLSAPYREAVAAQTAALAAAPGSDPAPALAEAFAKAGLLAPVVSGRLAAAAAKILTESESPPAPEAVLADAARVVYPEDTFEACWEKCFLDLPPVLAFKEANGSLAAAERRFSKAEAGAGEKPAIPHGMVIIPKGRFIYGPWKEGWTRDLKSPDKETKERVEAFFIDVHEVTNEDYREFLAGLDNAEKKKEYLAFEYRLLLDGSVEFPDGQELWPVRGITFLAATAYAESLGKRLPTEEEWEKAARGEDGQRWPWGNEFDEEAGNFGGEGQGSPSPVGSFPKDKSPYGVFDLAGNVSELTSTLDERRPYKGKLKATDSIIFRGGNYAEGESSTAATYRWIQPAISGRSEQVGFRCVISEKTWKRKSR